MTVINGIEIDAIDYKTNEIKHSINNNEPIESQLHVIIVISNPCFYARRYRLLNDFVKRMEIEEPDVILYVVEMIYPNQKFMVTSSDNKHHLQLKTVTPLWNKENMINLAVKNLLPQNYRAFAWIDADIEFDSCTWAMDTLKILNGSRDIVQLFSHCVDMDRDCNTLNIFNGFGYSFEKNKKYIKNGHDYWHPGYAWAITRRAYEKVNGLYDKGVLGSGDSIMALSVINKVHIMNNIGYSNDYNQSMLDFQQRAKTLRLGYTPGIIRHHFHGSKVNRRYTERWKILMKWNFCPTIDLKYNSQGIIEPSSCFLESFKQEILEYFKERKEDD
jgi:hypothetical protein